MPSLTRAEAVQRADLVDVESYEIDLDLTGTDGTFRSAVTIRFSAAADSATFVEVKPVTLDRVRLNDADLDPALLDDNRLPLTGLRERNVLTVEATMAYTNTGEALHHFVDPADGETYVYATSALDEAQRIFAAFDQPDLKATIGLSVTAPPNWVVAANGALAGNPAPGRWEFVPTAPLSTYLFSLIGGAFHSRHDEHDGIPLAIYARRSLAEQLDAEADEIFTVTRQSFDEYHRMFGVRYPFGKYDQAFMPEFNMGAMENPGLVTFRDDYLFRSAVTESEREWRAVVIAHEMAHMWFGNLVTMRWWDDLWLNESFADYFGYRVTASVTRFTDAWASFAVQRKRSGYAADQRPSTHPVAPEDVPDVAQALTNLDGISYAKGASVLRQLVAWLGDDAFLAGLRAHFATHRFGNATLADLLSALEAASARSELASPAVASSGKTASDRDLAAWGEVWLRRSQVNTLRVSATTTADGRYAEVAVTQTAPPEHPTLRPHRMGLGLYDSVGGATTLRRRVAVDLAPDADGGRAVVRELAGEPVAGLLLPNDGDLTFAKVRLDDASAAAVPAMLPTLPDPVARAVLWSAVADAVADAERPVGDLVTLLAVALPVETNVILAEEMLGITARLVDCYLPESDRLVALDEIAGACRRLLGVVEPGSTMQLAATRGLVRATRDTGELTGLLTGAAVPAGLAVDRDLRWLVLGRLVVLGAAGEPEIARELAVDRSAAGEERAAYCRAALPDPEAKRRAWELISTDETLSNRQVLATANGFWQPEQDELTEAYVERYFADSPRMAKLRTPYVVEKVAQVAFPAYAVRPRTRELAAALLARDDLPPTARRSVVDRADDLRRALVARSR
ncbi:aminopeptidase N [Plantactinospora sp. GCM10030261]|uniref:aminopeptidase N n=1 Tax=Plantactinospora sp. GCM10030261 TaxID=3273420 RepID=UPI00360E60AC